MGHKDQCQFCKLPATTYLCQVFIPSFTASPLTHEQRAAFQLFFLETRASILVANYALGRSYLWE